MIAWRIAKRKYATRKYLLSGAGAKETGGRWNRMGLAVVYASATSSLALLEILVHAEAGVLPASLVIAQITIPDDVTRRDVDEASLPRAWREVEDPSCLRLGSTWLESRDSLMLSVPSSANSLERNILLNPANPEIERCSVRLVAAVEYDVRLLSFVHVRPH